MSFAQASGNSPVQARQESCRNGEGVHLSVPALHPPAGWPILARSSALVSAIRIFLSACPQNHGWNWGMHVFCKMRASGAGVYELHQGSWSIPPPNGVGAEVGHRMPRALRSSVVTIFEMSKSSRRVLLIVLGAMNWLVSLTHLAKNCSRSSGLTGALAGVSVALVALMVPADCFAAPACAIQRSSAFGPSGGSAFFVRLLAASVTTSPSVNPWAVIHALT